MRMLEHWRNAFHKGNEVAEMRTERDIYTCTCSEVDVDTARHIR